MVLEMLVFSLFNYVMRLVVAREGFIILGGLESFISYV